MYRIVFLFLISVPGISLSALDWTAALDGVHRSEVSKGRDIYRHPRETLEFFGLREGQTIIELSPGGGWYTEILAPLTLDGMFYASHFDVNSNTGYARRSLGKYLQKLGGNSEVYQHVIVTQLPTVDDHQKLSPDGSADIVVAFRNVHSWLRSGNLEQVLEASFSALKPGGILGIVQHRSRDDLSIEKMKLTGYVTEDFVISSVEKVGFKLEARSEINANPLDTSDHPKGVWSLPPSYSNGEKNRSSYSQIGESDRMTLRFVK